MNLLNINFLPAKDYNYNVDENLWKEVENAFNVLESQTGKGNDYLGWLELPVNISKDEVNKIKEFSQKIRQESDVLLVCGIGGSYLGAKACLEMLKPYFKNSEELEVIFVGQNLSSTYVNELKAYLKDKDFSINVISKSGTTLEPAVSFRIFKDLLEEKYGENYCDRIYATTDPAKGLLRKMTEIKNFHNLCIPSNVGGRYSVLTPVGLLPICAAGINIDEIINGSVRAYNELKVFSRENLACQYAYYRNLLYRTGKKIEILVSYEPKLAYFAEWFKQLFGESEGKEHKGIFVSSCNFTTDLHSLGQYIQDGERILFETVINVENPEKEFVMFSTEDNLDQLNYLEGKSVDYICKQALQGTAEAHNEGGVSNIILNVKEITPEVFGYLVYFFEKTCGISAYTLDVNPFNQEGVEAYKKNMFRLLGKN